MNDKVEVIIENFEKSNKIVYLDFVDMKSIERFISTMEIDIENPDDFNKFMGSNKKEYFSEDLNLFQNNVGNIRTNIVLRNFTLKPYIKMSNLPYYLNVENVSQLIRDSIGEFEDISDSSNILWFEIDLKGSRLEEFIYKD